MHKIIKFDPRPSKVIISAVITLLLGAGLVWFLYAIKVFVNVKFIAFWGVLLALFPAGLVLYYVGKIFARGEMQFDDNELRVIWQDKLNCVFDLDKVNIEKWRATWDLADGNRKALVYKLSDSKNTFTFFVEIGWNKYDNLPNKLLEGTYVQVRDKTIFQLHPKFQIV